MNLETTTPRSTLEQAVSLTSETSIRVARIVPITAAEGPGNRFAVWVQGCAIRCDGCFNPHLWTNQGGSLSAAGALAEQAIAAGVQGVTLLGGEPTEQAAPLAVFAAIVRDAGLSVMTFTGHTYEELRIRAEIDSSINALLDATDLLVDGPYLADRPDLTRPWVGATKQQFRFLTDRYADLRASLATLPDKLEVRVSPNGAVAINGWATVDQLDELLASGLTSSLKRGKVR
jgi:anaerobic ribonucleoside-triphosphate reductase activating protein